MSTQLDQLTELITTSDDDLILIREGSTGIDKRMRSQNIRAKATTKADVALGNVDNTSDVNKPVSTAQQAALDAKAPTGSPTFTGTVTITDLAGNTKEIYHQGSILGTVSQTAGVPTGAVIERGSNANGEFVKFADGTLICTTTLGVTDGELLSYTFPSSFAPEKPQISLTTTSGLNNILVQATNSVSTTSIGSIKTFQADTGIATSGGVAISLMAIGRWF